LSHRPGDELAGRYRLLQLVGRGGMGEVWRGLQIQLEREVALKKLLMPSDLTARGKVQLRTDFLREGKNAVRCVHVNVVQVYDVVNVDPPWLVMEYVRGENLHDLRHRQELGLPEVTRIGLQVLAAIEAVHGTGVLHRDIKPRNILISTESGTPIAKLADFGIAIHDTDVTLHRLRGTLAYMAPELFYGAPGSTASDIYAFGATLFHAVAGHPPFEDDDDDRLVEAIRYRTPVVPPAWGRLGRIVGRMLQKDDTSRPTIAAIREELQAALRDRPSPPPLLVVPRSMDFRTCVRGSTAPTMRLGPIDSIRGAVLTVPPPFLEVWDERGVSIGVDTTQTGIFEATVRIEKLGAVGTVDVAVVVAPARGRASSGSPDAPEEPTVTARERPDDATDRRTRPVGESTGAGATRVATESVRPWLVPAFPTFTGAAVSAMVGYTVSFGLALYGLYCVTFFALRYTVFSAPVGWVHKMLAAGLHAFPPTRDHVALVATAFSPSVVQSSTLLVAAVLAFCIGWGVWWALDQRRSTRIALGVLAVPGAALLIYKLASVPAWIGLGFPSLGWPVLFP
jgi:serine/threonine protein kinase